jgi:hypothetical protein
MMAAAAVVAGVAVIGSLAPHVGAKQAAPNQVEPNHFVAPTTLSLVGGENPAIPGDPTPGVATAGTTLAGLIGVTLEEMDAVRFPASVRTATGTIAPCLATLSVGSLSGTAPVIARDKTRTDVRLIGAGTITPGSTASVDVVCTWTDRKGVSFHHETHWLGTL